MHPPARPTQTGPWCATIGCSQRARWETRRDGKPSALALCDAHLADKIGKYPLTIHRIGKR